MVWNIHYKEKNAKFSGLYDALYDHSAGVHGEHDTGKDGMEAEEAAAAAAADGSGGGSSTFLTQGGDDNAENKGADETGEASATAVANNSKGTVQQD